MFDGSSLPHDWFGAGDDERAGHRAALRCALLMTAAAAALTLVSVVVLASLFPATFEINAGLAFPLPC